MSNKITKLQAEYLIEQILNKCHNELSYEQAYIGGCKYDQEEVRKVIRECVEEDLDFELELSGHDDAVITGKLDLSDFSAYLGFSDDDDEMGAWMPKEEFNELFEYLKAIKDKIDGQV